MVCLLGLQDFDYAEIEAGRRLRESLKLAYGQKERREVQVSDADNIEAPLVS